MKKLKLLLVDDETEFVDTLADRLRMRDLEAEIARDGKEALSAVEQEEPDVIVLDVKMPGMDGIEVLRRVKDAYPDVEVIILTGHGNPTDEAVARGLGVFDYVRKPVDLDALVPRIKNAFRRRLFKLEQSSMAAAFAEAGEFETAKQIMEEDEQQQKKKKRKKP